MFMGNVGMGLICFVVLFSRHVWFIVTNYSGIKFLVLLFFHV